MPASGPSPHNLRRRTDTPSRPGPAELRCRFVGDSLEYLSPPPHTAILWTPVPGGRRGRSLVAGSAGRVPIPGRGSGLAVAFRLAGAVWALLALAGLAGGG